MTTTTTNSSSPSSNNNNNNTTPTTSTSTSSKTTTKTSTTSTSSSLSSPSPPSQVQQSQPVSLKMLVSKNVAGKIIGKGGSAIVELQSQSNCKIKLSNAGEYFPSTNERVCLVQGRTMDCVKRGLDLLMRRFVFGDTTNNNNNNKEEVEEEEDSAVGSSDNSSSTTTTATSNYQQLRILIPSAACGLLIGKSGLRIQSISVSSKTRINMGQKSDAASISTAERIFSIFGGQENIRKCVYLVLECMEKEMEQAGASEDESVWRYINPSTSYNKATMATYNNNINNNNNNNTYHRGSGGSGTAATTTTTTTTSFGGQVIVPRDSLVEKVLTDHPTTTLIQGSGLLNPLSACSTATATTTTQQQQQQQHQHQQQVIGGQLSPKVLQVLVGARELGGILSTTTTPSSDHVLGGAPLGSNNNNNSNNTTTTTAAQQLSSTIDYASLPGSSASEFSITQAATRVQPPPRSLLYKLEETAGVGADADLGTANYSITLAIPDPLVGAIIGQSGSTLTQLQLCSRTRIQISRRGEFVAGTKNKRMVKIVGQKKENCDAAQYWIAQRILMAQEGTEMGSSSSSGSGGGGGGRGGGRGRGRGGARQGRGRGGGARTQTREKKLTVAAERNNE